MYGFTATRLILYVITPFGYIRFGYLFVEIIFNPVLIHLIVIVVLGALRAGLCAFLWHVFTVRDRYTICNPYSAVETFYPWHIKCFTSSIIFCSWLAEVLIIIK